MLREKIFRSRMLLLFTIISLNLIMFPFDGLAKSPSSYGSLVGFIYAGDMKTPVKDAVVKIRNIEDGKEYSSLPTDVNGAYKIEQVKEGRYILGVSTPEGNYNFEYMMAIKAGEIGKLSLALKAGEASTLKQEEPTPEKEKVPFFKTPAGIAVLVVAGTVALYGVFKLIEGKEEASPSKK